MKKQILKKRTKKFEERDGIVKNKESENVIKNYNYGITLIALVITVVLNCSCLAMERMLKNVNILKIQKISDIIDYVT